MNDMLLKVVDNMYVQSRKQFILLRELLSNTTPEMIEQLDALIVHFDSKKTLDEILFECAEDYFGVSHDEIISRTRKRAIADARSMCISFMAFADYKITWQDIGRKFGMDHSSALHSAKKFCDLYKCDDQWRHSANDFFATLEKYGYNCEQTKQKLRNGCEYFVLKGSITRTEDSLTRKSVEQPTNKIERMSFHCAIS